MQKTRAVQVWKLGALISIILLAAFLRLYRIDSLPPGDSHDPAFYGVDALRILQGEFPIFLPTYDAGREALYSYWVTLWVAILGIGPYALHVASALIGVLTIPATFILGEELFTESRPFLRQYGGLIAALTTAVSYWHLNMSRFGVRAILIPLFFALIFSYLWRAIRTKSRRFFVIAGFWLGLGAYTYQVARLAPVLVVLAFLHAYQLPWRWSKSTWINLLIVSLVAILVFAPLGCYFLIHPGSFSARVDQALVFGEDEFPGSSFDLLFKKITDSLLFFNFRGDFEYIHTLPGRPGLNPYLSVLFFLGLGAGLVKRKPHFLFIIGWLVLMTIPSMISYHGSILKRLIGTFPAVMLLVAMGSSMLMQLMGRRHRLPRLALITLLCIGFVYSGIRTYREYFLIWAKNPDLFVHFEAGLTAMGKFIGTRPSDEAVYVSPPPPQHPSLVFNSGGRTDIRGYNGRTCTIVPERTAAPTTYIVIPGQDENTLPLLEQYFPAGDYFHEGPLYYDQSYFLSYRIPSDIAAHVVPQHVLNVMWADKIRLLGYDLAADKAAPGSNLDVTLYYRAVQTIDAAYTVFVHLWGPNAPAPQPDSTLVSQDDSEPCRQFHPTTQWRPDEIVRDQYNLTIPADVQPGTYYLQTGFYQWPSLEQMPLTIPADEHQPLILQEIEVQP